MTEKKECILPWSGHETAAENRGSSSEIQLHRVQFKERKCCIV